MTGFRHRNDGFLDNGITVSYNRTAGTQKPEYSKKTADNALGKAIYALGKVLKTILLK